MFSLDCPHVLYTTASSEFLHLLTLLFAVSCHIVDLALLSIAIMSFELLVNSIIYSIVCNLVPICSFYSTSTLAAYVLLPLCISSSTVWLSEYCVMSTASNISFVIMITALLFYSLCVYVLYPMLLPFCLFSYMYVSWI